MVALFFFFFLVKVSSFKCFQFSRPPPPLEKGKDWGGEGKIFNSEYCDNENEESAYMIVSNGVAIHSSFLAWKILWTEDPGGLQFTGSQKARHDLVTKHIDTG